MSSTKSNKPTEAQIKLANRQQELTDELVPMIVSVDFGTSNSCIGVGWSWTYLCLWWVLWPETTININVIFR